MAKCAEGMCHQGMIGAKRITASAWGEECKAFQKRIDDWNEKQGALQFHTSDISMSLPFAPFAGIT